MARKIRNQYRILIPLSLAAFSLGASLYLFLRHRPSDGGDHAQSDHSKTSHFSPKIHHKESDLHQIGVKKGTHGHSSPDSHPDLFKLYQSAWINFHQKLESIQSVDQDNIKLRAENTRLRLELETLRFAKKSEEGKQVTSLKERKLSEETGSKSGRTLASLEYKAPTELLPMQLYTLGVSYFKAREDEKAAVLFTTLANLSDTDEYRSAKHLLATGVAWYRVENYSLADSYFNEVLKKPDQEDVSPYQARARLWKALVAKKLGKKIKVQYWLRDLVDYHPYAPETAWINSGEVKVEKSHH